MQPIRWTEPKAFRDAIRGASAPLNFRRLGIWLAAGLVLFVAGRLMITDPLPDGWEVAFIGPIALIVVGVVAPWFGSYMPSSVFLDVFTIEILRPSANIVRAKLSDFSEFRWQLHPGYAVLCLRRKDGKPDLTIGVPLGNLQEEVSRFLLTLGIARAK